MDICELISQKSGIKMPWVMLAKHLFTLDLGILGHLDRLLQEKYQKQCYFRSLPRLDFELVENNTNIKELSWLQPIIDNTFSKNAFKSSQMTFNICDYLVVGWIMFGHP